MTRFVKGDRVEWDLFCGAVHTGRVTHMEPIPDYVGTWVAYVLPDHGPPARPFAATTLRPARRGARR